MDANKINIGMKLTKKFEAGQFDEIKILRKTLKLLISKLDYDTLTEAEKETFNNFSNYNNVIEGEK